jgi:hypothetical protein
MNSLRQYAVALVSAALMSGLLIVTGARVSAESVKLTGCLVKGEGSSGFLLVNAPIEPGSTSIDRRSVAPGAMGTAASFANVFYWLEKDNDLTPHIGHRVEIEGDIKGDVKKGEMKIDRKDQWTEIKVKSNGHEMKALVPNASVIAGPDSDRKIDLLVRRLDPEKVRMIDAACR